MCSILILTFSVKQRNHAATAFAFTRSIACRIPAHTDKSVNTSTMLPRSVKGASCKTDKSFIMPLCTMYSTIWFTKKICLLSRLASFRYCANASFAAFISRPTISRTNSPKGF